MVFGGVVDVFFLLGALHHVGLCPHENEYGDPTVPITYRDANTLKRTHGAQLRVASNCRCGSQWPLLPEQ